MKPDLHIERWPVERLIPYARNPRTHSEDQVALLAEPDGSIAGNTDEDAVPETPETAVTVAGDLWLLGEHRLLCGDSTQRETIETVLAGGLADMTWSDLPYNVNYGQTMKDKLRGKKRTILNDNLGSGFEPFLLSACTNILAVTKGAVYICMSSSELHTLHKSFTEAGGHWSTFIIWAKNTFTMGRSDYQRQYEPILYGWKEGTDHYWCGARDQGDVWFVKKPVANDLHPTTGRSRGAAAHGPSRRRGPVPGAPRLGAGAADLAPGA
ncbi:MAG: hypothetical protein NZM33_16975 [Bryobacteraceae bacterium]|nr:hypothetical protein [Bryobacteraceae bacterium]